MDQRTNHVGPLIVSGMPRSGTSLMMRILSASGLRAIADETRSYESKLTLNLDRNNAWLLDFAGDHAVKILFPFLMNIPKGNQWKILWMTRDPKEQAKSQRKVAGWSRKDVSVRTKLNRRVNEEVPRGFVARGNSVEKMSFERLISKEPTAILKLEAWLGFPVDTAPVVDRRPESSGLPLGALEIGDWGLGV